MSYNMNIVKDFTVGLFEDISSAFDDMTNRIMEPIVEAANKLSEMYQDSASGQVKSGIDIAQSRIHALFGQKFHPEFPDQRRDCDNTCGCGYFPTECTRYGYPGIDLKWGGGWKIRSPVSGMMYPLSNSSVRIKPVTSGFEEYEIILSNIQLLDAVNETGVFVDAGQNISTALGKNGCEDPHFNLAMKRISGRTSGLCYFVDPSPFLDKMQPIPTWHQECKDFTFKHIGSVIDFFKLTDGFKEILQELKRAVVDLERKLVLKAIDALPDSGLLGQVKVKAHDYVENVDLSDPANLKNLVQNAS
nr:hypothetical protein BaRGS_011577 [Batillaria attramentaria]